jgi:hypothetical protein
MQIKVFMNLKKYTLTSSIKAEDIELVKKYRPKALKKQDSDGNDVFAISYVKGKTSVSANGITFGGEDYDTGHAIVVDDLPDEVGIADYVLDKVSAALPYIEELERELPAVVAEIQSERERVANSIVYES